MTIPQEFDAEGVLLPSLPQVMQLALAYAPKAARRPTLALLALDQRLAGLLRHSREPMLAQLRLAWWRETLARDAAEWPEGEPLLAALRSWNGAHPALVELVDGWEALTGVAPLGPESLDAMADGRGAAFGALADVLGCGQETERAESLARSWALHDLATHLGHPGESIAARRLAQAAANEKRPVSRALRPLVVLEGLARDKMSRPEHHSAFTILKAMRLGILGA